MVREMDMGTSSEWPRISEYLAGPAVDPPQGVLRPVVGVALRRGGRTTGRIFCSGSSNVSDVGHVLMCGDGQDHPSICPWEQTLLLQNPHLTNYRRTAMAIPGIAFRHIDTVSTLPSSRICSKNKDQSQLSIPRPLLYPQGERKLGLSLIHI